MLFIFNLTPNTQQKPTKKGCLVIQTPDIDAVGAD